MTTPNHEVRSSDLPAEYAAAVTPSNTVDLTQIARAIYVGGAGDVNLDTPDGSTTLFKAVPAGTILPVRVRRVRVLNTTATDIVALY